MEPPSCPRVSLLNLTGRRRRLSRIRNSAQSVLQGQSRTVEIVLVDDDAIRELNRAHRDLDEATDVLTFPAPEFPRSPLGEIVISVPYAERQALARGIRVEDELCYLAIHGALHLLGLEDETEEGRRNMQQAMARWGQELGLPDQPEWSSLLHEPVGGVR
ncbi:MAG: rRNA maturation RNase YbeY [Methanoregulaceae archaeon]|nr:rRNA maturation RNase YbeY [Methanoregulaceae archaeon]